MDAQTLSDATQIPLTRAEEWAEHIEAAMEHYSIRTPMQQAAFLAQTHHESGGFMRVRENLNYSTPERIRNVWPYRFRSIKDAELYVRKPEKLANIVYANRMGNGDEYSGDGWRYRGRGLIQITGKDNYRAAAKGMGLPLLAEPELLEEKEYAAASAGWYWYENNLNYWADKDDIDSIGGIINRGDPDKPAIAQDERREAYVHALYVLEG